MVLNSYQVWSLFHFFLFIYFLLKLVSYTGTMAALSVMVNLELPHVNILSKMDLLSKTARRRLERFLEPDCHAILGLNFFYAFLKLD